MRCRGCSDPDCPGGREDDGRDRRVDWAAIQEERERAARVAARALADAYWPDGKVGRG